MVLRLKWLIALTSLCSFFNYSEATQKTLSFKKEKIELRYKKNNKILNIEIADTEESHARGLMFREKLNINEGMLFVFEDEAPRNFWMKNTLIDLDIAFFDKNKTIVDIQSMKAVNSIIQTEIPSYSSKKPAQYALEMARGWFKKNGFKEGTKLKFLSRPSSK